MPKRTKSSGRWLAEHFSDVYVKRAQQEGWRSRAVFKLEEIQQRDKLIKPGMTIVDLGAAPGGWSQYAAKILEGRGTLLALDILPMEPIQDVKIIQGDFTEEPVLADLQARLMGRLVDLVLSDMAPNISGEDAVDQPRSLYLAELALAFVRPVLDSQGAFLVKTFQGTGFPAYLQAVRRSFHSVVTRKPVASRARSRELYLLAKHPRA
ncbi:MAG: 23S rRNA (uridine(2552)-2'-O)-methyltransferase RlmE [Gammaproteobacteria bacterium]